MRVDEVSKSYREGETETQVLHGVGLELVRGETTSLVGRSGSGKSTLISLLAGLLLPDAGTVVFDGREVAELGDAGRARLRASRIGVVLQRDNLIPFLSACENVELAMEIAGAQRTRARARDLLGELGLGRRLHHRPSALSGGESQRVAVAVALANEQVMGVIFEAWRERGLCVLYVTHSDELATRAERRLRLSDGAVHPR